MARPWAEFRVAVNYLSFLLESRAPPAGEREGPFEHPRCAPQVRARKIPLGQWASPRRAGRDRGGAVRRKPAPEPRPGRFQWYCESLAASPVGGGGAAAAPTACTLRPLRSALGACGHSAPARGVDAAPPAAAVAASGECGRRRD